MTAKIKRFQSDLQNGMSIADACSKHNLTFKEAVEGAYRPLYGNPGKPRQPKHAVAKNITQRGGHLYLRKYLKGKGTTMFGTYKTLDDALKMKEHCNRHGWIQRNIDQYCQELGIIRCMGHHNEKVRYH